ncbi:MAG TPA: hypothetical protein VFX68_07145 [Sulfuricurvum sp.]|nr:hypothetical protein [Sulfuricurvum sp.]
MNFYKLAQSYRFVCKKYPVLRRFICRSSSLLYADELPATIPQNTVLILPPSDYWALNATLNVNTQKEAALFGPALFDLGEEYHYEAQKIGSNHYTLIAYNPTEISLKLESLQDSSLFEKITFTQWVFADEPRPIRLKNGKYLTTLEGIVIEIDASYVQTDDAISMDNALNKEHLFIKTIPLERLLPTNITPKTLKTTLIILLIVLGNLLWGIALSTKESSRLSEASQALLNRSKLPETSIEREAILSSLVKKEEKQLRLRHHCLQISDIPIQSTGALIPPPTVENTPSPTAMEGVVLIPGSKPGEPNRLLVGGSSSAPAIALQGKGIEEFIYDGNSIKLVLNESDLDAKDKLKKAFRKKFKKIKFSEHGNQLEVRIQ